MNMIEVAEYLDADGKSPFGRWFGKLKNPAAAKVTIALARIGQGILTNIKSVGTGVQELRIDSGPGYRIYFGREGDALVILLAGGTKRRQATDIKNAKRYWKDYRKRKYEEG